MAIRIRQILIFMIASVVVAQEIDSVHYYDKPLEFPNGKVSVGGTSMIVSMPTLTPEWYYTFPEGKNIKILVGKDTVRTDLGVYQTMVILTLIQQWDEYSKECYADSMESDYFGIVYIHREPTLKGFFEFLKRRVK
jgi:hypothetical protein